MKGPGGKDNLAFSPSTASGDSIGSAFDMTERGQFSLDDDGPGKKMTLRKPLEVSDYTRDRIRNLTEFFARPLPSFLNDENKSLLSNAQSRFSSVTVS